MRHFTTVLSAIALATTLAGCGGDDNDNVTPGPTPVAVTETFTGTLTVNGLQVQPYNVNQAGTTSVQLTAISDANVTIALSLGTWNGVACQIIIVNPAAALNTAVTGTAQNTGQFCTMLQDTGKLTTAVDYTIEVTHF